MSYQLILKRGGEGRKRVGENLFLEDLATDYPCYALYYPSEVSNAPLETALRRLGEATGGNLFVNMGTLVDRHYDTAARLFRLQKHPVIVITAIAPLAAPEGADLSAFVRIDSPSLLRSPDQTIRCVQEVYTLFLQGRVAEAIAAAKWSERKELLHTLRGYFSRALGALWELVSQRDITVSLVEGRFELKRSMG
jgi:hypothetical protein